MDSFIGVAGPSYTVPIERGAIRQFAKTLYSSNPAWLDDPQAVIPPTFLVTAGYHWGYILERPPLGSPLASIRADTGHMMDGEQSFVFFGPPPRAGDVLTASTKVADHSFKTGRNGGRLEFFKIQTDFHDDAGKLVAQWLPTSIRTERVASQSFVEGRPTRPYFRRGDPRNQLDRIGRAGAGLLDEAGPGPITMPALTLTDMIKYQCASGEDSTAHHDGLAARADGFPEFFSVGMHHAAVLAAYAAHWLGAENARKFQVRFQDMIWPGDVLTYSGRPVAYGRSDEGETVDLELQCTRDGTVVTRGWATFLRA